MNIYLIYIHYFILFILRDFKLVCLSFVCVMFKSIYTIHLYVHVSVLCLYILNSFVFTGLVICLLRNRCRTLTIECNLTKIPHDTLYWNLQFSRLLLLV